MTDGVIETTRKQVSELLLAESTGGGSDGKQYDELMIGVAKLALDLIVARRSAYDESIDPSLRQAVLALEGVSKPPSVLEPSEETPMAVERDDGSVTFEPYSPDRLGFDHDGERILNPFRSPCGNKPADPVDDYGFNVSKLEGGGLALIKRLDDEGTYLWLTDSSGKAMPDLTDLGATVVGCANPTLQIVCWCRLADIPS